MPEQRARARSPGGPVRKLAKAALYQVTHLIGRLSGRQFFEDYVRVYPDGVAFDRLGRPRAPSRNDLNNFLNHRKFYRFAAQFVSGKRVADVGCGSGHGCEILKQAGAAQVSGSDVSKHALRFARERFGGLADFVEQGITDLSAYGDTSFDVTISSEVLEHIKEYGMEEPALRELRRITRDGGYVIVGTPNCELLGDHGFSFDEVDGLFESVFSEYSIFENALLPFGAEREAWLGRQAEGRTGIVVSESIDLAETVLPAGVTPELKIGIVPGPFPFGDLSIDTRLLHNTHSWVVVARR